MRKNLYFFISVFFTLFLFLSQLSYAQTYNFPIGKKLVGFEVKNSNEQSFSFRHGISSLDISDFDSDHGSGQLVELPGIHLPSQAGAPNLPSISRMIAIPQGAKARLEIKNLKQQIVENIDLLPAPAIPLDTDDAPLQYIKDQKIYAEDGLYPSLPFQLSEPMKVRGVDVVMMGITPFQYNPVTKELIIYYDIEAEVVFEGGNGVFGDERLRSIWWEPILQDHIFNSNILPEIDYSERAVRQSQSRDESAEYIIITPNNPVFTQWADSIRIFRQRQGISTKVVSVTDIGGNTVTAIQNYVTDAYNNWDFPPAAILMLGDYSTNATDGITSHTLNNHPGGYNPYISDNPFSDMTGNNLPDIVFARITARNAAELENMINKSLDYERNPPTNAAFYDNPITAMGWQTERWFQICSETVNGFWEHALGKNPVRENAIYSGSPGGTWSSNPNTSQVVNYFGPNGLNYIPATTSHLTDWGGNATRVNNDINSGAFMLQHRDHGLETGWGEPHYRNEHLSGLNNADLTYVLSINCLTGKFNYGQESFTEAFHRHNHGALGLLAATEVSYSFVNDVFVWGAFDNMWPDFMPDFGTTPESRGILPAFSNAAGKYFLLQSNWPYNPEHKNITYQLFHHHGDAFMTVYSEMPQDLMVDHMSVLLSGLDVFEVTANTGALIALSIDDEIIGMGVGKGNSPTQIPIIGQEPGVEVLITVTLQNYYRYEQIIECIPPSGPYVIFNAYEIDDSQGNNNGQVDYDETVSLDITLKNVGSEATSNLSVVASSDSPYITLLNNSFTINQVAAGQLGIAANAISFTTADNVPNKHMALFELAITSGSDQWTAKFTIPVYAPALSISAMSIDDASGNNNGRLDPGETVQIIFTAKNTGQSDAHDMISTFVNSSPYLIINEPTQTIQKVEAEEEFTISYTVTVSGGAPIGTVANFGLGLEAGAYTADAEFMSKIGLIIEDFETGDFSQFDWVHGGQQPWQIVSNEVYAGSFAAKSGSIGNSQNSQLSIQYEVGANDTISFYYKVSSENNYDHLRFYIDNSEVGKWSGSVNWTKASFPVSAGVHTFRWEYKKDYLVSNGQDCAWIDDVVFPPLINTSAWAGPDLEACIGNTVQLNGAATHYNSVQWATSGTGSFSNATILDPVYLPSQADYNAGSITLSLTANGSTTVTDHMELSFYPEAEVFAGNATTICPEDQFVASAATASNYASLLWSTSGDGSFSNTSELNASYTPGPNDIANKSVTLSLKATGMGDCPDVISEVQITIYPLVEIVVTNAAVVCTDQVMEMTDYVEVKNALSYEWTTSGDGEFTNPTALETVYTPGTNDIAQGGVTITLSAQGEGNCQAVTQALDFSIFETPEVDFGQDLHICQGEEATVEIHLSGQGPWEVVFSEPFNQITIEASPYQLQFSPTANTQISVLTIADANCQAESDAEVWVYVYELPVKPEGINAPDTVDFKDGYQSIFDIIESAYAQEYTAYLEPEEAGTIDTDAAQVIIDWNPDFLGEATIRILASNICGESELSDPQTIEVMSTIGLDEALENSFNIFPNPANDKVTVSSTLPLQASLKLYIKDMMGRTIHTEMIQSDKSGFTHHIQIGDYDSGMYLIIIESDTFQYNKKLIISNQN